VELPWYEKLVVMNVSELNDINLISLEILPTPFQIKQKYSVSEAALKTVLEGRKIVQNILNRQDHRLFVVVGPCSVHDTKAALEYAKRLKVLSEELSDTLYIVMRVYFEKPRTTVGWKGLINDPYMDDSFQIGDGLNMARKLLLDLAEMGLTVATEALDPISPQYLSDLVTWAAIGARTTESQTHREMSSGLSTPVGFKNGTDGNLTVAINAMHSVSKPHHFLGIDQDGQCAVIHTRGNNSSHVVLRGGGGRSNYDSVNIALCEAKLREAGLPENISVDCSHGNSMKDYKLQPLVLENCVNQIIEGNHSIIGVMLESNLRSGNQPVPKDLTTLEYGVSVTDACIDWEETERILRETRDKLKGILPERIK